MLGLPGERIFHVLFLYTNLPIKRLFLGLHVENTGCLQGSRPFHSGLRSGVLKVFHFSFSARTDDIQAKAFTNTERQCLYFKPLAE